ncbi:MAG: HAD family phosphatase [Candidatus Staskawiczbacteria bacterium]|nr:HAD family phosphatase [Candidatus Staskawiczbacteria bacterium]MBI3337313.1 HAD family phosphatase [Candidatus Staskawiczbacteria bacterium]
MSAKKLAIFDIDGTIFRSSLLIEITDALITEKIFPEKVRDIYAKAYENWLDRKGSYEEYIEAVVNAFVKNINGVRYSDFAKISKKVIISHQNRVYRYTRELILDLKKKKYYLLAISNSPKTVVDEFCKKWGFNKSYGRIYELDKNGKFTGKILHEDLISDKAKILKRAIEKENLTINNSVGVGDSESDIAFLKLVKEPICFNPNNKLYLHAKKAKWKITVERKDVIYHLS